MEKSARRRPRRTPQSRRRVAAAEGKLSQVRPAESPANFEFARRMAGTLPETIVAGDLEILNSGLHLLFADLRRAYRYFQDGEGNGRGGASSALGALYRFIVLFEKPFAEGLQLPIQDLQQALAALEDNNVLPMLKPVRRRGRAISSDAREALKGHVAGTVRRLLQTGINLDAAYQRVAKELKRRGVRPERGTGNVTATTVRHWCDRVAADVGRRGAAAVVCDSMFTASEDERFSFFVWLDRNPEKDVDHKPADLIALDSLAGFVAKYFPNHAEPKNPLKSPI
jgi:hypothetical protein